MQRCAAPPTVGELFVRLAHAAFAREAAVLSRRSERQQTPAALRGLCVSVTLHSGSGVESGSSCGANEDHATGHVSLQECYCDELTSLNDASPAPQCGSRRVPSRVDPGVAVAL